RGHRPAPFHLDTTGRRGHGTCEPGCRQLRASLGRLGPGSDPRPLSHEKHPERGDGSDPRSERTGQAAMSAEQFPTDDRRRRLLMLGASFALVSCGGGGSPTPASTPPSPPPAPTPAPPPPAPTPVARSAKRGIAYDLASQADLQALA